MWGWHDAPGGWGWFWMVLMMAVVWAPVLLAGLWVASQLGRGRSAGRGTPPTEENLDARELARQAYARGGLDRERFLQVIADLDQTDQTRRGPSTASPRT